MKNYQKILVLLFVAHGAILRASFNPTKGIFAGNPWGFIENHFVLKPEKEGERFLHKLTLGAAALSAGIASGTASFMISEHLIPETITKHNIPAQQIGYFSSVTFIPFAGAIGGAKYCAYLIQQMIDYKALDSFLNEWPENKYYTPEQFHQLFDNLYATYILHGNQQELKELSSEIVAQLQRATYEHFPSRYAHRLQGPQEVKGTFLHYIVSIDVGEILKLLANIFNAFSKK